MAVQSTVEEGESWQQVPWLREVYFWVKVKVCGLVQGRKSRSWGDPGSYNLHSIQTFGSWGDQAIAGTVFEAGCQILGFWSAVLTGMEAAGATLDCLRRIWSPVSQGAQLSAALNLLQAPSYVCLEVQCSCSSYTHVQATARRSRCTAWQEDITTLRGFLQSSHLQSWAAA